MADKKVLVARLRKILDDKGKEISEAEAQARLGDRFYAEVFGFGSEIRDEELAKLYEIADRLLNPK